MPKTTATTTWARCGPEVSFVHTFAEPGQYKVWDQFSQDGEVIPVPLVIEVRQIPGACPFIRRGGPPVAGARNPIDRRGVRP